MSQTGILPFNPDWEQLYQNATVELDAAQLPQRIAEARATMLDQAQEILDKTASWITCSASWTGIPNLRQGIWAGPS
jgi:hypothetical protein